MSEKYTAILLAAGCSQRLAELTGEIPKSFLKLGGRKIIEYNLDHLYENKIDEIIMVLGYKKDMFINEFGSSYKGIPIKYAVSEDYINTDNGYSLYLSESAWKDKKNPVLIIDADMYFEKGLLREVIESESNNTTLIEGKYKDKAVVEEMVLGKDGIVSGFERTAGIGRDDVAGEQAGITKLSSDFIEDYYSYCQPYFEEFGFNQKYERVFDHVLKKWKMKMDYIEVDGFRWININKIEDYESACRLHSLD